jgi:beta-lysine 5,6-aminomutase beta subunit
MDGRANDQRQRKIIRPYGDRLDDGVVQMAFVLPVPPSEKAREAAKIFMKKMGFAEAKVATMEQAAEGYSFFVAYGHTGMYLDYNEVDVPEVVVQKLSFDELNASIEKVLGRRIVVYGACTGTDSHTVGIDAIMNMKGFAGDYGLERYPMIEAHNLGAQVPNDELIAEAKAGDADAILVSQVVTQREVHKENARDFIQRARGAGLVGRTLLLLGGPRVDHKLALELGFDAGFGAGTKPSDVANFIAHTLAQRLGKP